jgi:hypothetical protein
MHTTTTTVAANDTCDLCIIGAGIAGLNALFAATQDLPATARVILVDRNPTCGGMWTQTYDYVRLHQPHQMFTVGDLEWLWDKPREYLATGSEVLWHLQCCLDRLRNKVRLTERFRTACLEVEEHHTMSGPKAFVRCEGPDGTISTIEASRVIHAAGWDIPPIRPLKTSSRQIVSTSPALLLRDDTSPTAAALIVGGGKTGMDTALALMGDGDQRKITLLNGKGAVFGNRDSLFPKGAARWWGGVMVGSLSAYIVCRFDGENAKATFEHFRKCYAISPDIHGEQYMFSTMSGAELRRLSAGLTTIRHGYLDDVIDGPEGPEGLLRDGTSFPIARNTLMVNCTGHFATQSRVRRPVLSPMGTILHINPRASIYFLSTSAAYFLTHAFYLNVLRHMPLFSLDMDSLNGKTPQFYFLTCLTHSFHNMMTFMNHVPLSVFSHCGLDINRWFPLHRRLISFARLKIHKRRYIDHSRTVLNQLHLSGSISCTQE